MNQPEDELARRIVRHLDHGVDALDPVSRGRLAAARKAALARYRAEPRAVHGLAWAAHALSRLGERRVQHPRRVMAIGALLLAVSGAVLWQATRPAGPAVETAEIDASILTGELPLNAYLDKGFDSWLKRSLR
jgi:hypothetical protein